MWVPLQTEMLWKPSEYPGSPEESLLGLLLLLYLQKTLGLLLLLYLSPKHKQLNHFAIFFSFLNGERIFFEWLEEVCLHWILRVLNFCVPLYNILVRWGAAILLWVSSCTTFKLL